MQTKLFYKQITSLTLTPALTLGLLGCMVGPDFETPEPPETTTYTENPLPEETVGVKGLKGGASQEFSLGKKIPAQWWELFHSEKLNEIMHRAFKNNPDIKSAVATLWSAEEDLSTIIGDTMYPSVDGNIFGGREQIASFQSLEGSPGEVQSDFPRQLLTMYSANVSVSYVFDVFGANRRAIEATEAQMEFERYELEATYLTLAGNIVTTAILEGSLREQIRATKEIINMESDQLGIFNKQYKVGGVSELAIAEQETILAQQRATLPPLELALAQTRHALAVLVGEYPGSKTLPEFYLDDFHLPTDIPVSVPSQLVRQRPDIRAAEALLKQANAEIGVATANLLPQFPIVGSYGPISDTLSDFFNINNIAWTWEADVLQPLFHGGALLAERESAIADFKSAFADYEATVLEGLQNVADSLSALEADARTLRETAAAEKAAIKTMEIVKKQYKAGSVNYYDALFAEIAYQQTYLDRINAQTARYTDTAALFQSLGGGWWNEEEGEE